MLKQGPRCVAPCVVLRLRFLCSNKGTRFFVVQVPRGVYIAVLVPGVKGGLNRIRVSPQPGIPLWRLCDKCLHVHGVPCSHAHLVMLTT